jgi:hypothetical protein
MIMKRNVKAYPFLLFIMVAGFYTNILFAQNPLPQPGAIMAGKQSGTITKNELNKAEKIECIGDAFVVLDFRLTVVEKDTTREFYSNTEFLTKEMISAIRDVPAGSKIYVEYIRAKPEKGDGVRMISPLIFTISE